MSTYEYHNAGNTEAQQKEALTYLLAQSATGKAATGVLSGLAVAQTTTASGSVLVGAGAGVVQAATLDGASMLVNDTPQTLDVFTANPMGGLPRNDIVIFDSITANVSVLIGTPNATPTDPTIPTSALPLARLRHAASATTIPAAKIDSLIVTTSLLPQPSPVWTAYTPTWTADTTNPTLGSGGSAVGSYRRDGNEVEAVVLLTWGASATGGAGNYKLSLPFAANPNMEIMGRAVFVAASGSYLMMPTFAAGNADIRLLTTASPVNIWSPTQPASSGLTSLRVRVRYTAA